MLRIDKAEKTLTRLRPSPLAQADHWERHLQEMICSNPEAFCEEIGEKLCLIGDEVRPSDVIPDRIDILALDEGGNAVIIELKRGSHKLQLLQAISYAGMVSRWSGDDFTETLSDKFGISKDEARSKIIDHVASEISAINKAQRVILIAEDFDPALLVAAEWLHEFFDVDLRCYRLQLSLENESNYLTCTCIYPPLEIATLTRSGESKGERTGAEWANWDEVLDAVENAAVREYFRSELTKKREERLRSRDLIYRLGGKRRLWVCCRKKLAYAYQWGRFEGDLTYWRKLLSEPDYVEVVRSGRAVRFHLSTAGDFDAFAHAVSTDLPKAEFSENSELADRAADD